MGQIVAINGKFHDLDYEPSLKIGKLPNWRTPIEINGKMVHGVNINGYDYPPVEPGCVLYYPGLPGQGSAIWDRSNNDNNGTIVGATWVRNSSGLWTLRIGDPTADDYINIDSVLTQLAATTKGTWMTWVKLDDATPAGTASIITFGDTNGNEYISLQITVGDYCIHHFMMQVCKNGT